MGAEVDGLVLAGGRSRRMGQDKAEMVYRDGKSQIEVVCDLLTALGVKPFVSLRTDQKAKLDGVDVVRDVFGEIGPVGAIGSAQQANPNVAWLVIACDLPALDQPTLEGLLASRDEGAGAVCFSSEHDGRPEPLCAIWEPSSVEAVRAAIDEKKLCARRLLEDESFTVRVLDPVVAGALDNANTPDEAEKIRRQSMK